MTDKQQLDRTYHYIMKTFIDRGDAPHYTEIAREFGVRPDVMAIMSTPRHSAKLNGHYVSSAAEYAASFFQKLREVTGNSEFWNPKA